MDSSSLAAGIPEASRSEKTVRQHYDLAFVRHLLRMQPMHVAIKLVVNSVDG
ncbi:hypothetical protein ACSFBX_29660 [Variovorax sp. RB2P76]